MKDSPCHGCEHRHPACHGSCELYKEWRQPYDAMAEDLRSRRIPDELLGDGRFKGYRKYKRGK